MDKKKLGLYYGILLIVVGLGVFFRIPEVMTKVISIEFFTHRTGLVKFCFYMLGFFLVIAGCIRIFKNYKK